MNETNHSKFVTAKWNIINGQSYEKYCVGNKIFYNTKVLKPNLCDCNNGYILVKGDINVTAASTTQVSVKHRAPLTKCIKKIDEATLDDAEDLDLVMLMYNLTEYSSNYSKQQEVYGFLQKMKQLVVIMILQTLIILNLSSIRINY